MMWRVQHINRLGDVIGLSEGFETKAAAEELLEECFRTHSTQSHLHHCVLKRSVEEDAKAKHLHDEPVDARIMRLEKKEDELLRELKSVRRDLFDARVKQEIARLEYQRRHRRRATGS